MNLPNTPGILLLTTVLAAALFGPAAPAQEPQGAAGNKACFDCHAAAEDPMEFRGGTKVSVRVEKAAFLASAHGQQECLACHQGLDLESHTEAERPTRAEYRQRLVERCVQCHGDTKEHAAVKGGAEHRIAAVMHRSDLKGAPLCTDCHRPHSVLRGLAGRPALSSACATCHDRTYAAYAASVHGGGVTAAGSDSPGCIDCHRGHEPSGKAAAQSHVRLGEPCMNCHGDDAKMEKHGISTGVVSTYLNDFHGTSVRFYRGEGKGAGMPTLVCADCHGIHDVAKVDAGNTRLMKDNLLQVCRKCHTDAAASFPDAWLSHYEPGLDRAPLVFLVKVAYWVFIPFVILGLSLQIFAHLVLFPRVQRRQRAAGQAVAAPAHHGDDGLQVTRFPRRARIEHLLVMLTFVLLLVTGLPQKFSDSGWAMTVTSLFGGIDMVRTVHRVTGIVFTGLCALHVGVALWLVLVRRVPMSIVPNRQDFAAAVQNVKYYIGAAARPPAFDRYDYRQKFEYWGMLVGSAVMIGSGFVLYFPMLFADWLPGQLIPAAKAAHTYEAMMALLTIIIWHMYGAHLNPDCFPLDKSIFTGKISLARMRHEHALEYERDKDRLVITPASVAAPPERGPVPPPEPAP